MAIDDGGPAFPEFREGRIYHGAADRNGTLTDIPVGGMSLRDHFAGLAPIPTAAAVQFEADRDRLANPHGDDNKPNRRSYLEIVCDLRYQYADGMIKARAK